MYNRDSLGFMSMNFSVIIPTLNEEQYLPKLLSDLASQTVKDFEVIVVDGRSKDKTKEKAQGFGSNFPLTFLEVDKRNVSYQRNTGAKNAKGNTLIFLDADTRIPKDFIKHAADLVKRKNHELILPSIQWDDKSRKGKILLSFVKSLIRASQVYGRPLATGGNFIIDKKLFESLEGFNEHVALSEDHDLVRRAHEKGIKARIAKNVKITLSMRRGELEGDASFIYKNVVAFLAYTMVPSEKALKAKLFDYEMGGHRYDAKVKTKDEKVKIGKRKIDIERLKQLLQLSSIALLIRMFK